MGVLEVRVREPESRLGRVHVSAVVPTSLTHGIELWFSVDERLAPAVTSWADPFVLAALWWAVQERATIVVKGAPVSPSLLRNLELFQRVWRRWKGWPVLPIHAEEERERPGAAAAVLAACSGGVDSAFTAWRHASHRAGAEAPLLGTAVMVQGLDITLGDDDGFRGAVDRARRMMDSVEVELVTMATNVRAVNRDWEMSHGLVLGACLTLLCEQFGMGLIPSSSSMAAPILPWGSNPFTDPLMGSETFQIVHDGDADRVAKIAALIHWPEARRLVRVCWLESDHNCGQCRKCMGTAIFFRCCGAEPECFEAPIRDDELLELLRINREKSVPGRIWHPIALRHLERRGVDAPWVHELGRQVREDEPRRLLEMAEAWSAARQAQWQLAARA